MAVAFIRQCHVPSSTVRLKTAPRPALPLNGNLGDLRKANIFIETTVAINARTTFPDQSGCGSHSRPSAAPEFSEIAGVMTMVRPRRLSSIRRSQRGRFGEIQDLLLPSPTSEPGKASLTCRRSVTSPKLIGGAKPNSDDAERRGSPRPSPSSRSGAKFFAAQTASGARNAAFVPTS